MEQLTDEQAMTEVIIMARIAQYAICSGGNESATPQVAEFVRYVDTLPLLDVDEDDVDRICGTLIDRGFVRRTRHGNYALTRDGAMSLWRAIGTDAVRSLAAMDLN